MGVTRQSAPELAAALGYPDPVQATSVADFVHLLRRLKRWAGNPSLATLHRRTGLPRSTICDALRPHRTSLPRLELVQAFVRGCGGGDAAVAAWVAAWRRVSAAVEPEPPALADPAASMSIIE